LMAMIAQQWHKTGLLKGKGIVATQMSNLGLEQFLAKQKLKLHRTKVGDRYVMEKMRSGGFNIGGEPSGHVILGDYSTTGDALIAALQVLAMLVEDGRPMSKASNIFTPVPQVLKNVRYDGGNPLKEPKVEAAIKTAEKSLGKNGRVLVRASGTEPLIRVMVEGTDKKKITKLADSICGTIQPKKRA
jgi:phosphoglucosamine mutase